jgi:hypothetical protein
MGIANASRSVSIKCKMSCRRASSIAFSGSSISGTRGLLSSARPIATRCFSPPERRAGPRASKGSRPSSATTSAKAIRLGPREAKRAP